MGNKQKTHKGAKKRFKKTGSGKIKRRQAGLNHFNEKMSGQVKRRLGSPQIVKPADEDRINRMLSS